MTVYIFLIILLSISLFFKQEKRFGKIVYLLDAFIIFAVIAFRDVSVGIDTVKYVELGLGGLEYAESKASIELLWMAFLSFFMGVSSNEQLFIVFTAILEFVPLFLFINKESDNRVLSLLLFVVLVTGLCSYMTTLRQSVAVGFILMSFYFLKEKKYVFSALFFLLALGFHSTAILALIFVIFSFLNYKKFIAISVVIFSALLGFIMKQDIFSAYDTISQYFTLLSLYSGYTNQVFEAPNFFGLMAIIVPSTIIAIFAIHFLGEHMYTKIFVVSVVLVNLFASTPFIERYFMYGTMLQLVLVPRLFKKGSGFTKLCIAGAVLLNIVFFFKSVPYATGTDKYVSFLFN